MQEHFLPLSARVNFCPTITFATCLVATGTVAGRLAYYRDQQREIEFPVIVVVRGSHYPGEKAPACNLLENGH